jgi:hypothetical protein
LSFIDLTGALRAVRRSPSIQDGADDDDDDDDDPA